MMQVNNYKYPFVFISVCLIIGIIAGTHIISYPDSLWLTIIFFILSLLSYWTKRTKVLNIFLMCSLIFAAALRYHIATVIVPTDHIIFTKIDNTSCFEGLIIDYQYRKDHYNKYVLQIEHIIRNDTVRKSCGTIILYTQKFNKQYHYGDRIQFKTLMERPSGKRNPGQFDYRKYLFNQSIFFIARISRPDSIQLIEEKQGNWFIQNIIIPLRQYCHHTFGKYFNDETEGMITALILGEKQDLDQDMVENFKKVGVVHVLAISGLHVGFIIAFIFSILSLIRLNYYSKIWALLCVLIIYIVIVRFKTPVVRASSMAILYLLGEVLERKTSGYNIIFSAMAIILIFDPRELYNSGFHFSFTAVLSIIYGYSKFNQLLPLNAYIEKWKNKHLWLLFFRKVIWIPFLVSLAAVIGTMPLTLYYYGMFPVYALLANLIVIPLTGLIVSLSLFLLFISLLTETFSNGLATMIQLITQGLQKIVEHIAGLPFASIIMPIPTFTQLFMIFLFILFVLNFRKNVKVITALIIVLVFIYIFPELTVGHQELQVVFLDVGQGDAAFLRFPNQHTMLIDGGDRSSRWDEGEKTILPFLQSDNALHINYLIGSHAHNDHIGGFLSLVNSLSIDTLVLSRYHYNSILFKQLLEAAKKENIPIKKVGRGDRLSPDSSCRVYILHPDSTYSKPKNFQGTECNNSSIVLKIQYGNNSILFTGDLERSGEQPLLQYEYFLESEILKVGHHGSSTSTSEDLLVKVHPLVAIISVGTKNKFHHPSPTTLERLGNYSIKTYQTSKEGAIKFSIGTENMTKINWK